MNRVALPVDSFIADFQSQVKAGQKNFVISAAPGSGKTTRLPVSLLNVVHGKILVLEPRRIAASMAASRVAQENALSLGVEVGYKVRFSNQSSEKTRLIYLTEALLSAQLISDPTLQGVDFVFLDEFHERSVHTDLAIGFLKELQSLERPDLGIVVMSATLDSEKIQSFLPESKLITIPGQPQELKHVPQNESQILLLDHRWVEAMTEKITKAAGQLKAERALLAFLPGLGEIERVNTALQNKIDSSFQIHKLHGSLSLRDQQEVLKPSSTKKIILATNVAESSLTIDGVDTVVDSGLFKQANYDVTSGFSKLEVKRISKASARQRAGRAARQFPGTVFQMWNKLDEQSLPDFEAAEILRSELSQVVLMLAHMGISDFQKFSWFQAPASENLKSAIQQLLTLKALDSSHRITAKGKALAALPLSPWLGALLLEAVELGWGELGCQICAVLSDRSERGRKFQATSECDLSARLQSLNENPNQFQNWQQIQRALSARIKMTKTKPLPKSESQIHSAVKEILFQYFKKNPDFIQLCRRRNAGQVKALNSAGRGVSLHADSQVKKSEYFFAIEQQELPNNADLSVRLACAVSEQEIFSEFKTLIHLQSKVSLDPQTLKAQQSEEKVIGKLSIGGAARKPAESDAALEMIKAYFLNHWQQIRAQSPALQELEKRFEFYRAKANSEVQEFISYLPTLVEFAAIGETAVAAVLEKDWAVLFESLLGSALAKDFQKKTPTHLQSPSGKNFSINYESDKDPWVEIKLQDAFGWKETPTILDGKIKITLHLLGPNMRPLQVTQDLSGFWKRGYLEIRNPLKARYPKHPWPEDPTQRPPPKNRV